ncbi:TlpA family protein disulfide reductase [Flavivirga spongiicola]|uniref:TlpA family protein disulfide reductase n=1 Tax=Flavivirga spongiicola TaxID=421621 RepID=A0ABU7XPY0_9FLAO|nr:TlpA disulfide reductase family protein [Flavivirga sp. MEBiC05379]MDO5977844.1 TlpA disulfide reductase family protein [Flavivirga sp. MEBiC05379]
MKTSNLLFLILIMSIAVSCANDSSSKDNGYTTIEGMFDTSDKVEVSLYKVEHGTQTLISTCQLNEGKQFGFHIKPDGEGFYVLNIGPFKRSIYIKENMAIKITAKSDGKVLLESSDEENKVLTNWMEEQKKFTPNFAANSNEKPTSAFSFYEKNIDKVKKYHDKVNTSNGRFNELMHALINLDIEAAIICLTFPNSPEEKSAKFYQNLMQGDNYKSTMILDLPGVMRAFGSHQLHRSLNAGIKLDKNSLSWMVNDIENDTLRGYYILNNLRSFKTYNKEYLNFIEPFRKDIVLSKYVEKRIADFESKIKNIDPGTQGYPFTYKDIEGKEVSFKDFKGKYVYIDVWATWCGPCKAEIPHIQKLEKELHDKDIQFVSISLDKPKSHETWKNFVEKEALSGIQLIAEDAFNSRLAKDYKIKSIPRFLLFDKDGVIVDSNAKRPSNPELKTQLEQLIN